MKSFSDQIDDLLRQETGSASFGQYLRSRDGLIDALCATGIVLTCFAAAWAVVDFIR